VPEGLVANFLVLPDGSMTALDLIARAYAEPAIGDTPPRTYVKYRDGCATAMDCSTFDEAEECRDGIIDTIRSMLANAETNGEED
jgi:hypothetical protein